LFRSRETAKGDIPYFDCESYVYGILDAYIKVRDGIPRQQSMLSAEVEPWRVLEIANPKREATGKTQSAASFLIDFLKNRYPCS